MKSNADLPEFMYLVTTERVRQGRPPLRFEQLGYDYAGTFIRAPSTYIDGVCRRFPTENCYKSREEAEAAVQKIVKSIRNYEQEKLNKLNKKLQKAVKSARQMASVREDQDQTL